MWPDQQPPGGAPNPQQDQQNQQNNPYQQPGYQQPNPYQQPGYQQYPQAGPYGQQPQWGQPGQPPGAPVPQPPQGGGGRTKLVAIVAATAVVVTAAVTGYLVLGGTKDDEADNGKGGQHTSPSPTATGPASPTSSATGDPRGNATEEPTVAGWKVVVNPKYGTAFDVPADWEVERPGVFSFFEDETKGDGSAYIGFSGTTFLKPDYCTSEENGTKESHALAAGGTKGENGAKDTASIARGDSATFAFGGYTDQSEAAKKYLRIGKAKPFTTASGVKGSVATSYVIGVPKKNKCDTDGKATTFAFKNSTGSFVSWTFYGAKGVEDEVPDATMNKILSTVRLHGDPIAD